MYHWQATWTPDGDSPEERRVRFEANYDRSADESTDVVTAAYRATRRQNVIDSYALTNYWQLADLTGTYASIEESLGEKDYPELTAWLEGRPEVVAVRPRTRVVDVILDSKEDGHRLKSALQDWLDSEVSATVERVRTRKPGTSGAMACLPRLRLRTEFRLEKTVGNHEEE